MYHLTIYLHIEVRDKEFPYNHTCKEIKKVSISWTVNQRTVQTCQQIREAQTIGTGDTRTQEFTVLAHSAIVWNIEVILIIVPFKLIKRKSSKTTTAGAIFTRTTPMTAQKQQLGFCSQNLKPKNLAKIRDKLKWQAVKRKWRNNTYPKLNKVCYNL